MSTSGSKDVLHPTRILVAAAAAFCLGNLSWWMQPAIVHDVMTRFHVGEADAGLVASVELASIALTSILFSRAIGHIRFLSLALAGACAVLVGMTISVFVSSYTMLLVGRIIAGLGEGLPLVVSVAALAGFDDPDKAYTKTNVANGAVGVGGIYLVPIFGRQFGIENAALPTLFAILIVLILLMALMPGDAGGREYKEAPAAAAPHPALSWPTLSVVLATFIVALMSSALWSFYFELGAKAGLLPDQVNSAIAVAALCSVLGALVSAFIGSRFGRLTPITVWIACLSAGVLMVSLFADPTIFRVGAILNLTALGGVTPYFPGTAAAQDPTGRDGALTNAAYLAAGAIGPYFGGLLLQTIGAGSIGWLVLAGNVCAWLLFWVIDRRQKRARHYDATTARPAALRS